MFLQFRFISSLLIGELSASVMKELLLSLPLVLSTWKRSFCFDWKCSKSGSNRFYRLLKLNNGMFSSFSEGSSPLSHIIWQLLSKNTHILLSFSSWVSVISLYSLLVIPTSIGTGASSISIKGCGRIGTKAKHHLKGYTRELSPRMAAERKLYLPTNTIDFSSKTAFSRRMKSLADNMEKRVGQNQ